jgi:hypothetical protein
MILESDSSAKIMSNIFNKEEILKDYFIVKININVKLL